MTSAYTRQSFLWMLLGVLITITMIIIINVQLSLSQIDLEVPESWPNMMPQTRYFFIPVLFSLVSLFSIIVNYLVFKNKIF